MGGIFSARYMLLLMSLAAVYAGLLYNDFFSLALNLFGSRYEWSKGVDTATDTTANLTCSYGDSSCVGT